jgi:colicin import membrane protein
VIRDRYNIIPAVLAAIVHAVVVASLVFAFDFNRRSYPVVPLKMQASLVTEADVRETPPVREPEPEPEPEPVEDNSEQERLQAEEEKRRLDMQAEQERIRLQEQQDRERREREETERKERAEAEADRQRELAERRRQEDLDRQRAENERLRREAEEAEILRRQQAEIDAEAERIEAMEASDFDRWMYAISRRIERNIIYPASRPEALECDLDLRLLPNGEVVRTSIGRCNGDALVRRAIESAVSRSSPLPPPENPRVFKRDLKILLKPTQ